MAFYACIFGGSAAKFAAVYVGGKRLVEQGELKLPAAIARFPDVMRKLHSSAAA